MNELRADLLAHGRRWLQSSNSQKTMSSAAGRKDSTDEERKTESIERFTDDASIYNNRLAATKTTGLN